MTRITAEDIPDEFICPITNEIMINPLMSVHGFSFEREAIFEWLQKHTTCPLSRRELTASKLVTNHSLQEKIQRWCKANEMTHLLKSGMDEDPDDLCRKLICLKVYQKQQPDMTPHHHRAASRHGRVRRALRRLTGRSSNHVGAVAA